MAFFADSVETKSTTAPLQLELRLQPQRLINYLSPHGRHAIDSRKRERCAALQCLEAIAVARRPASSSGRLVASA
jgi:hypothetical protein